MKVSICEKCPFYQRKTWSQRYKPNNYHAIGMTHAYGYCMLLEKRCGDIAKKDCNEYLCRVWHS